MTGIDAAQDRWQAVRARGRTRGLVALAAAVLVILVIAIAAGGNSGLVVGVVVAVVAVLFVIGFLVSQRRTGLKLTPEWAPKDTRPTDDDWDDDDRPDGAAARPEPAAAEPEEEGDPVRSVDGQILGADLAALGQTVGPKLAKSYALGTIELGEGAFTWRPGNISAGQGVQPLSSPAARVVGVERAPLWGSWALLRVELADGQEWCFRLPSSVDLAPACAELGIAFSNAPTGA